MNGRDRVAIHPQCDHRLATIVEGAHRKTTGVVVIGATDDLIGSRLNSCVR